MALLVTYRVVWKGEQSLSLWKNVHGSMDLPLHGPYVDDTVYQGLGYTQFSLSGDKIGLSNGIQGSNTISAISTGRRTALHVGRGTDHFRGDGQGGIPGGRGRI